ncbi:MAG: cell division protein SepF, partial [Peptoanaerobacter stomatis]|uniref:cell division protein SepF n=1 Tax=Peptoanaerobacter stomatis TaxID=796937 RepID=UPI003FA054D8
ISKLINSVREGTGIPDEDYEEDYEEDIVQEPRERTNVRQSKRKAYDEYNDENEYEEDDDYSASFSRKKKKVSKSDSKVVPITKKMKSDSKVYIVSPKVFEDVEDISDRLLAGYVIALNIEALEDQVAQRIIDFMTGTMHAIDGKIQRVSKYVYLISPENVEMAPENEVDLTNVLFVSSNVTED